MSRSGFFKACVEEENKGYQAGLLAVIGKYISRNYDKPHKKNGIKVAKSLQAFVLNEGMTDTEMMAHMLSCIKMQYGTGALNKSVELRGDILQHLFEKLHVSQNECEALILRFLTEESNKQLQIAVSGQAFYPVNEDRLRAIAMLDLVEVAMIKQLSPSRRM